MISVKNIASGMKMFPCFLFFRFFWFSDILNQKLLIPKKGVDKF